MLRWLIPALCAIALAGLPLTGNDVLVQYGIDALLFATLAQAWNILGGFTGYVSFGNSSFYGLGTYGTAIAMAQLHLPSVSFLRYASTSSWRYIPGFS